MAKVLLIVNPNALRGKIKKYIPQIEDNLHKNGFETNLQYTKKENNAYQIIKNNKNNYDIAILCSGDGTVNEAINAMMHFNCKMPIGLIPLGTMNDFAHSIKMPYNKQKLSKDLNKYVVKKSDTGRFNQNYFNYVAAFGVFSNVGYETSNKWKHKIGKIAYFIKAFEQLFRIKSYMVKARIDGQEIDEELVFGSISNSKTIARIPWFKAKQVNLEDGKFEVILIKSPQHFFQLIPIFLSLVSHRYKNKHIIFRQAHEIQLDIEQEIQWTLDGEDAGKHKKVQIENIRRNIEYLVPKGK